MEPRIAKGGWVRFGRKFGGFARRDFDVERASCGCREDGGA